MKQNIDLATLTVQDLIIAARLTENRCTLRVCFLKRRNGRKFVKSLQISLIYRSFQANNIKIISNMLGSPIRESVLKSKPFYCVVITDSRAIQLIKRLEPFIKDEKWKEKFKLAVELAELKKQKLLFERKEWIKRQVKLYNKINGTKKRIKL